MVHGQIKLHKETKWHQESAKTTQKKKPMAKESAEKHISKKKPMASRIHQEEYQQEETNGVKNPPRRNTARRTQWCQESAEKNYSKK